MSIRSASPALAAALLFGASTPLAKLLLGNMPPLLLAGLLYLGSGLGLGLVLLLRRARRPETAESMHIPAREWPWLFAAILFGGLVGPALLASERFVPSGRACWITCRTTVRVPPGCRAR